MFADVGIPIDGVLDGDDELGDAFGFRDDGVGAAPQGFDDGGLVVSSGKEDDGAARFDVVNFLATLKPFMPGRPTSRTTTCG